MTKERLELLNYLQTLMQSLDKIFRLIGMDQQQSLQYCTKFLALVQATIIEQKLHTPEQRAQILELTQEIEKHGFDAQTANELMDEKIDFSKIGDIFKSVANELFNKYINEVSPKIAESKKPQLEEIIKVYETSLNGQPIV